MLRDRVFPVARHVANQDAVFPTKARVNVVIAGRSGGDTFGKFCNTSASSSE